MIEKQIINNNFSKCARYYDRYSSIQNICASKLIAKIQNNSFGNILEIGCGTGNYTKLLKNKFPSVKIRAVDISPEMIEVAKAKLNDKTVEFIVADGETMDFSERFDFISSNASFQWFENIKSALSSYNKLLNRKGLILFSVFGPLTFCELNKSLVRVFGNQARIAACDFVGKEELARILCGFFGDTIAVDEEIIRVRYASLEEFLKVIRYTGAKGEGITKNLWTPKTIFRLEEAYKKELFIEDYSIPGKNGIVATYQVFFCQGVKQ